MKTTKGSKPKSTKLTAQASKSKVRRTHRIAVEMPDLKLSRADTAALKKAFRNALVCSIDQVAGVLKPKQKTYAVALKCSTAKPKAKTRTKKEKQT